MVLLTVFFGGAGASITFRDPRPSADREEIARQESDGRVRLSVTIHPPTTPIPKARSRDGQGRATDGLYEQTLPPRQVQMGLNLSF